MSASWKHRKAPQLLTDWRPMDNLVSRLEIQQGTIATHRLESQRQALSKGYTKRHHSYSQTGVPRASTVSKLKTQSGATATYRLESQDKHCQQARNTERHHSHSQTEEPRTGIFSWLKTQQGIIATHRLESQRQASSAG